MWHASIARLGANFPITTDRWGEGTIREAKRLLSLVLKDVGREPTVLTRQKIALHMRRSLSDSEISVLSADWLAIPARDEFSEDGQIEMTL